MRVRGRTIVIGAGIVGVSAAIWLRRAGVDVTLLDRGPPGRGASYGNGGVLASCAIAPVTGPGMLRKAPGMLLDPDFPLFLRWSYLPRLAPWLRRYLAHANDADTRRIAAGLARIIGDSVDQHRALAADTPAADWIVGSDYSFAYADRAAFERDAYVWGLRREAGFEPEIREGAEVRARAPSLGPGIGLLATMRDHGFIRDPGAYVAALAEAFAGLGGSVVQADFRGFDLAGGRVRAVETDAGRLDCDAAVLATGAWSKPLMRALGVDPPLESERGYHVVFEDAAGGPDHPIMVASGKFVATPMAAGLRCAGILEFGGLAAGPSRAPLAFLHRHARLAFPELRFRGTVEWMGHRPAPSDSLPVIGEISASGVFAAFGHHHVGLTGGPKTGRLVAQLVTGRRPTSTLRPSPRRGFNDAMDRRGSNREIRG